MIVMVIPPSLPPASLAVFPALFLPPLPSSLLPPCPFLPLSLLASFRPPLLGWPVLAALLLLFSKQSGCLPIHAAEVVRARKPTIETRNNQHTFPVNALVDADWEVSGLLAR